MSLDTTTLRWSISLLECYVTKKMKHNFVELVLTCGSWQEAQKIAYVLLEQRLVACVEFMEIKSKYRWQQQLEGASEIKMIMTTIADNFDKVKTEVRRIHSYEVFVLKMLLIEKLPKEAAKWLNEEISNA